MWGWLQYLKPRKMLGIDVSHNNGAINWAQVSTNSPKIDFVYIKATQGVGYVDPKFKINATLAKDMGLKVGYYHFCSLNDTNVVGDATNEAKWFISNIIEAPIASLPLALDIELDSPKTQLSKDAVVLWIKTFFNTLISNGYTNYVLYSYTPFLDSHLPLNHPFGNIPLWIAAYTNKQSPILPKGWKDYWMWQYTDKGKVNGINTSVDMNRTSKLI